MAGNTERDIYLNNVKDFVDYLVKVIRGDVDISHRYYDRTLKKQLVFDTLLNAFNLYHWKGNSYDTNKKELKSIQNGLRNAKNDQIFYNACDKCLEWGAGGKGQSLYVSNMGWIDKHFPNVNGLRNNIAEASKILTSNNPNFIDFGETYRMNAGFTKIYALYNKNFIIYDGRVGAAFGYLVSRYGGSNKLKTLPEVLKFPFGVAKGKQNRNPSIKDTIYKFSLLSNNKKHAQWNVRANWILTEAAGKVETFAGYTEQESLRAIEAALFMVGYDIPDLANSTTHGEKASGNKKTSVDINSKQSKGTLSTALKKVINSLVDDDNVVNFTPKQVFTKANKTGLEITIEQVRSVLLRDCINAGSYYSGGTDYYKKIKRGIYKRI